MLLRLAPSVLYQVITSLHDGHITLLIPIHVLLPATTLWMSWRNCMTLEQRWFRRPNINTGVSALFLIGFSMVRTHALHHMWLFAAFSFAQPLAEPCWTLRVPQKAQVRAIPSHRDHESFAHNIWNSLMVQLFHVQPGGIFEPFVDETDLARIPLSCHFAFDSLCDKRTCSRFRRTLRQAPLPVIRVHCDTGPLPPVPLTWWNAKQAGGLCLSWTGFCILMPVGHGVLYTK